jgi:lipopolysaccharide transport system permease protein
MAPTRAPAEWQGYDAVKDRPRILRYLAEIPGYPLLIWKHRSLVRNFYRRELLGRFRGSVFGLLWVLIHPIFLFVTYYLVFGIMFGTRSPGGQHELWYPLFLFSGVIAWTAFAESTTRCTSLVVENGNLIKKVSFPAQLLPLHILSVNVLVFLVGAFCYFLLAFFTGFPMPGLPVLLLPLVLLVQLVMSLGLSLLLGAVHVFYRDIQQIYPILMNFWFFATPIFWYVGMIQGMESLLPALEWNPMFPLMLAHRDVLGIPDATGQAASFVEVLQRIGTAALPAFIIFVLGYVVFRSLQHRFADEV